VNGKKRCRFQVRSIFHAFTAVVCLALHCTVTVRAAGIVLDGWDTDFVAATNRAVALNRPLVLFWANQGCEHCEDLEKGVQTAEFASWRNASPYLFCFVFGEKGKDPDGTTVVRDFAASAAGTKDKALTYYPFICLYWPKRDGSLAVESFTTDNASKLKERADKFFAGYEDIPAYVGADLEFNGDYPRARLEAEVGFTAYVDVPLVREGAATPFAATNVVVACLGDVELLRDVVVWKAGESRCAVRVTIPNSAVVGDVIAVALNDEGGGNRGVVNIHIVGEQHNSTKNPFFIGEKTAETLSYGEWTMDLDVAMEKYRADPDAKLMAIASGSLWCPDCMMTDEHILETEAFKTWAVQNKVILVDIDVPNFPNVTNSACLLTRVVGRTSDGYISGRGTLATNELERYQSGDGYLSRHMVSDQAAAAVLARNQSLVGKNTLNGGWNNPDRTNQNRTGIPNFFALRRDGTVAGSFETFDAIGPSEFKDAYLRRFSELIALCVDGSGEFANRSWQTTKDSFDGTSTASADLSAIDLIDTYKLVATKDVADMQTIMVRGGDTNTVITVSIISVTGGTAKTLSTVRGSLSDGVGVSAVISSTGGDYYVSIAGEGSGTLSADSSAANTITAYVLTGTRTKIENPFSNDWTAKATTATLPLFAAGGSALKGTLALTLKKDGKITAKYSDGKKTISTFSGKWDANIAADGTATAFLSKKACTLSLVMSANGIIAAEVDDGTIKLNSGNCGLAENYGDFAGTYTVLFPATDESAVIWHSGFPVMTLKMATTKAAKANGRFSFTVYLPDGKKLSGTSSVTWCDANFGIVPVLKTSGVNTFSAALKVRRNAGAAPSARAIVAIDGAEAMWTSNAKTGAFAKAFDVRGSWYDKKSSLLTGIADEMLNLKFSPDISSIEESPSYGALVSFAGQGSKIVVTATKATAEKTTGFTFKLNHTTGIVTGTTRLTFSNKRGTVSAKYIGVLAHGWFSDCDCGEDSDGLIEMENIAFVAGYGLFADKVGRKTVIRSFPVAIR